MKFYKIKIKDWVNPELITVKLAQTYGEKGIAWLDSDGSENGKWSILGCNPKKVISCRDNESSSLKDNPFHRLREIKNGFWMGWLSYEAGVWLEPKNSWHQSDIGTLWIASYDPVIKFNLFKKEIIIEGTNTKEIEEYKKIIQNIDPKEFELINKKDLLFDFSNINLKKIGERFKENITNIKKLILEGDIFQANLTVKCELKALKKYNYIDIYSKIRNKLKAPFGGIIIGNCSEVHEAIISTSPERFLKINKRGYVETRPIKGTRPRDKDQSKDAKNAIELITHEKDRAENIMIVDLLRNDLGKVCEIGTIRVTELLKLESFLTVHHLTSVIKGKIKKDKNWVDLLEACWPGGSITGAPKIRACERIFQLEGFDRGPYCGSFIKIGWDGEFDSNILIRSFILKNEKIRVHAGCGIVFDSNPEEEEKELKWKLLPLINSLK